MPSFNTALASPHRVEAKPSHDNLLNCTEAAAFIGVTRNTFYNWRKRGIAPRALRVGPNLRFLRADLERFLRGTVVD